LGFAVHARWDERTMGVRATAACAPAGVVIDLGRLPSQGRGVAAALAASKTTGHLPIVFVDGAADKVADARRQFPHATFTTWAKVGPALRRALRSDASAPRTAAGPQSVALAAAAGPVAAGYSGTPLPKKLGIRPGHVVLLVRAPQHVGALLGPLPEVTVRRRAQGVGDVIIWFVRRRRDLEDGLAAMIERMAAKGQLWVAWPKGSSGVATDLGGNEVRELGLAAGVVDTKVCAIDATWSGLRFSRRASRR